MSTPLIDSLMIGLMKKAIQRAEKHPSLPCPVSSNAAAKSSSLKLLFAGYTGANNMGADVRVEEMLRQFRHLFGEERVQASVFSFGKPRWEGAFGGAERLRPQLNFPNYLSELVPAYDGVIACEGSLFKSHFTDLLPAMMIGALGLASASGRLSVAYGAEAGTMSHTLAEMARDYCSRSYIIARNEQSRDLLSAQGLDADVGTDTAWTFESSPAEYGFSELRKKGWAGEPILVVCPVNPFWWPVNISLVKSLARWFGFFADSHYGRVFFHQSGVEVDRKFENYLNSMARGVKSFCRRRGYFPVVAACERLDRIAMERLGSLLGGAATFNAFDYEPKKFVSILRRGTLMLSSRYHAVVTTMPSGVVSAGVSMDERLSNLLADRGHSELLMKVNDSDLGERIDSRLECMHLEREKLSGETEFAVLQNLKRMSRMGRLMVEHVQSRLPQFDDLPRRDSWEDYLPPFSEELESLVQRHEDFEGVREQRSEIVYGPMPVVVRR